MIRDRLAQALKESPRTTHVHMRRSAYTALMLQLDSEEEHVSVEPLHFYNGARIIVDDAMTQDFILCTKPSQQTS